MWINDNKLTEIRGDMWEGLQSLLELYLFDNRIRTLHAGAFRPLGKLQALWLWQNELTVIQGDMWQGLHSLRRLYLENNKISSIKSGGFTSLQGLSDLEYLGLIDNQLMTLRHDILTTTGSPSLTTSGTTGGSTGSRHQPGNLTLILSDNPLQCDSRLCWLKKAEQEGWINFYYFYSYESPRCVNLHGISWEDIRMDCECQTTRILLPTFYTICSTLNNQI